jgi:hypothetical protein
MREVVGYIKDNRDLIGGITTKKVNVDDIVNNLTTNVSNKPLSAAQGVVLKNLIDALPTESGPCFVIQPEAPEDTSVVWVDLDDVDLDQNECILTEADRRLIVNDILAAFGESVLGRVDEQNNIILTGALADGTYTLKYEFADGSVITIGTLEHHAGTTVYTNQISISTDYDDSIYNGTGYASGARIRSNGEVGTVTYTNAPNIIFLTGFIPVKNGDVVRMKNCFLDAHSSNNDETAQTYGNFIGTIYTAFYDSDKTELGKITWMEMREANEWFTYTPNSDGNVTEFTVTGENVAYLRLNPSCDGDPADAIITVNEEIPE